MSTQSVCNKLIGLALAALSVSVAASAQVQNYTAIDLGTLPGGYYSYAYGINNSGQVVGSSTTASGDQHAFLYSGGTMIDLGTLPGGSNSYAAGINNSGQVVGSSDFNGNPSFVSHAFLYSAGALTDLNNLVSLPSGVYLTYPIGINDLGQIAANGSNGHGYLLTPGNSLLTILNPFAPYALFQQPPPTLDVPAVLSSPPATSLAADGESAVVLAYQSTSPQPVAFALSASGTGLPPGAVVGSLGPFDPDYLANPIPVTGNLSYQVTAPTYGPDAGGNYEFLALLWAPNAMPLQKLPE